MFVDFNGAVVVDAWSVDGGEDVESKMEMEMDVVAQLSPACWRWKLSRSFGLRTARA